MRRKRATARSKPSVVASNVDVTYGRGSGGQPVLESVSLHAGEGTVTQVVGSPGTGKSTLLRVLAAVQKPTSGTVRISGVSTSRLRPRRLAKLARTQIAPLFDDTTLIPSLSVLENLALPGQLRRTPAVPRQIDQVVSALGLGPILERRPDQLSKSEGQLARCGRLLLTPAPIVVADEPLRHLGSEQAVAVQEALRRASFEGGKLVIVSGQEPWQLSTQTHVWTLSGGRLTEWVEQAEPTPGLPEPESVSLSPVSAVELDRTTLRGAPVATPPSDPTRSPLSPEQREVVARAQQILDSLPGQVAPTHEGHADSV